MGEIDTSVEWQVVVSWGGVHVCDKSSYSQPVNADQSGEWGDVRYTKTTRKAAPAVCIMSLAGVCGPTGVCSQACVFVLLCGRRVQREPAEQGGLHAHHAGGAGGGGVPRGHAHRGGAVRPGGRQRAR